jgi:hypothetical protein
VSFDPVTRVLTLHLDPRYTGIVSATFETEFFFRGDAGSDIGSTRVTGQVNGNTLTFDLSADVPPGVYQLESGGVTLVDGCGRSGSTFQAYSLDFGLLRIVVTEPDGGAPEVTATCFMPV